MADKATFPVCIVGGTSSKRYDVACAAQKEIERLVSRPVLIENATSGGHPDTWDEFDIAGREVHSLEIKLVDEFNQWLVDEDRDRQAGLIFCADSLLTVYGKMAMSGISSVPTDSMKLALLAFQSLIIEIVCKKRFFTGGYFLLTSEETAEEDEHHIPVGSPEAVETYIAEHLLDGLQVTYTKLSPNIKTAAREMAGYLVESLRFERSQDGDSESEEGRAGEGILQG